MSERALTINLRLAKESAQAQLDSFTGDVARANAKIAADATAAAKAEAEGVERGQAKATEARKGAADRAKALARGVASETMAADSEAYGKLKEHHSAAAASAESLGSRAKAAAAGAAGGFAAMGTAGVGAITQMITALPGLLAGMGQLKAAATAYSDAMKAAAQAQQERTKGVLDRFEGYAHLAGLEGATVDTQYVVRKAQQAARVGMKTDELVAAQDAFYASGNQYIGAGAGKKLSRSEADQLTEGASSLALAKGLDPKTVLGLAGKLVGMKDWQKQYGDRADLEILAELKRVLEVNASGSGDDNQLAQETAKLAASSLNDDKMKGVFQKPTDVAKLVSVLTEGFPEGQAEAGNALLRTLGGFDKKKGGKLLSEAGVGRQDDTFTRLRKLATTLQAKAKAGPPGTTIQDVIRENVDDELGGRALAVAVNQGVFGGLFAARDQTVADNAGTGVAPAEIDRFQQSQRGRQRLTDASKVLGQTRRGARTVRQEQLRQGVEADMEHSGTWDRPGMILARRFVQTVTLGLYDPKEREIMGRQVDKLRAMMPESLRRKYENVQIPEDPNEFNDLLGRMMADLQSVGVDPETGARPDPASPEAGALRLKGFKAQGVRNPTMDLGRRATTKPPTPAPVKTSMTEPSGFGWRSALAGTLMGALPARPKPPGEFVGPPEPGVGTFTGAALESYRWSRGIDDLIARTSPPPAPPRPSPGDLSLPAFRKPALPQLSIPRIGKPGPAALGPGLAGLSKAGRARVAKARARRAAEDLGHFGRRPKPPLPSLAINMRSPLKGPSAAELGVRAARDADRVPSAADRWLAENRGKKRTPSAADMWLDAHRGEERAPSKADEWIANNRKAEAAAKGGDSSSTDKLLAEQNRILSSIDKKATPPPPPRPATMMKYPFGYIYPSIRR